VKRRFKVYFRGSGFEPRKILKGKVQVKLSLWLVSEAVCHEDIWGSGGIAPSFLTSALMEMSGQLHAPAALSPWKEPSVLIGKEAGFTPELVWTLWRREKIFTAGNRTRAVHPVVQRYTDSSYGKS
jgi:hypothetical protein